MNRIVGAALLILAISVCAGAQETNDGSAKAIFGPVPFPKPTEAPPHANSKQKSSTTQGSVRGPARVATGLKYWVELVQPDSSQLLRVNATRIFHSGERIRLHLQSNVEGRIMLFQLNSDGTSQLLFPDRRLNHGDNHIQAGTDTAIPAG